MNDPFLYFDTSTGPVWLRASIILKIEPESQDQCQIETSLFCNGISGKEYIILHESALSVRNRINFGAIFRLVKCASCQEWTPAINRFCIKCDTTHETHHVCGYADQDCPVCHILNSLPESPAENPQ